MTDIQAKVEKAAFLAEFITTNGFMKFIRQLADCPSEQAREELIRYTGDKLPLISQYPSENDNVNSVYAAVWSAVGLMNGFDMVGYLSGLGIKTDWEVETAANFTPPEAQGELAHFALNQLPPSEGALLATQAFLRATYKDNDSNFFLRKALVAFAENDHAKAESRQILHLMSQQNLLPVFESWRQRNEESNGAFLGDSEAAFYNLATHKDTSVAACVHLLNAKPEVNEKFAQSVVVNLIDKLKASEEKSHEGLFDDAISDGLLRLASCTDQIKNRTPLLALYFLLSREVNSDFLSQNNISEEELTLARDALLLDLTQSYTRNPSSGAMAYAVNHYKVDTIYTESMNTLQASNNCAPK